MNAITHISQIAFPRPELRPFIQVYGQRDISVQNATLSHPLLPCLGPVLSFDLADLSKLHFADGSTKTARRIQLFGSHASMKIEARFQGTFLEFGIFLKPFACWQLFRIPPAKFTEAEFDAEDVFGRWMQEFWMRLAECRSFPDRVSTADRCLLPFALDAGPVTRTMRAGEVLLHSPASSTIEPIAYDAALSVRTFGRTFSAEMGITPRTVCARRPVSEGYRPEARVRRVVADRGPRIRLLRPDASGARFPRDRRPRTGPTH